MNFSTSSDAIAKEKKRNKLGFTDPYIFASQWRRPFILNTLRLKISKVFTIRLQKIGIRKFESVAKTQIQNTTIFVKKYNLRTIRTEWFVSGGEVSVSEKSNFLPRAVNLNSTAAELSASLYRRNQINLGFLKKKGGIGWSRIEFGFERYQEKKWLNIPYNF